MLATFCARVALGMIACLLLLSPRQLHPRFFRTQFLTALGLLVVATLTAWPDVGSWPRGLLVAATVLSLLGAFSWTLDPPPGGRTLIVAVSAALIAALWFLEPLVCPSPSASEGLFPRRRSDSDQFLILGGVSSSMFLGTALTAMLVGHSYLISPRMALAPLMRSLFAGGLAFALRIAVIGWALWRWTEITPTYTLDIVLWLPVRWLVGVIGPLGFGWMAYSAARIRSTQSATGILYVVVVCAFLGELLGLLLTRQTGLPL